MFIDEGFGTLDSEKLNLVMKTLNSRKYTNRLDRYNLAYNRGKADNRQTNQCH